MPEMEISSAAGRAVIAVRDPSYEYDDGWIITEVSADEAIKACRAFLRDMSEPVGDGPEPDDA